MQIDYDFGERDNTMLLESLVGERELQIPKKNDLKEEYMLIDQYLNPCVFEVNQIPEQNDRVSNFISSISTSDSLPAKKQQDEEHKGEEKKNRSIFHNVQKHLITYLRKIHLRRIDLVNKPSGLRAYELWKIFKYSKEYTKKCLYIIFGVEGNHNVLNLLKMADSLPELSKMIARYPFEEIERAQALIRERVYIQISQTPKNVIKLQCKMAKFQQFYDYLQTFLEELSNEGLSMRIRKQQKQKVMQKRAQAIGENETLLLQ